MAICRGHDRAYSGTLDAVLIIGGGAGEGEDHAVVVRFAGDLTVGEGNHRPAGRATASMARAVWPWAALLLARPSWAGGERERVLGRGMKNAFLF